jgi:hypothetical protein
MDLIVGGGSYGLRAVRLSLEMGRPARVFDPDPGCRVARFLAEENPARAGISISRGGIHEAYRFFVARRPEWVYPTAPVHVAARLIAKACHLHEWEGGIGPVVAKVPDNVRAGGSGADAYLSFNPAGTCICDCASPVTCPVTGEDRSVPLFVRLREWCPEAVILESVQRAPGLGAIRGTDLFSAIARCRNQHAAHVGTACRCHGIMTAFTAKKVPAQ